MNLHEIASMPVTQVSELPAEVLQQAMVAAMTNATQAKAILDHIEYATDLRYGERAKALRLELGKDTGVVHFDDGRVRVTAELPKRVKWNQKLLADLVSRIAASGDNPAEYVDVTYRVSETKYLAWQESLRSQFTPARNVEVGSATYRLALLSE